MSIVIPAKKYHARRQPSEPPASMIRGTTGPATMRANDDPVGTMLDANPSRRASNQDAMRVMDGTKIKPLPRPVTSRPMEAPTRPSVRPVKSIPAAVSTIPKISTFFEPMREARTPPTAAISV
jgi:hypothetical protein